MSDPRDGIGFLLISAVVAGFLLLVGYLAGSSPSVASIKRTTTPSVVEQCASGSVDGPADRN